MAKDPDFTVRIVDANGDPDSTVAVIDGIADLTPSGGDLLVFNEVTGRWEAHPRALNDLSDVDTTGQAEGDTLVRVGDAWVPQAPGGGVSGAERTAIYNGFPLLELPSGSIAQNGSRGKTAQPTVGSSGQVDWAPIWLPEGAVVSALRFFMGSTGLTTPSLQRFGLYALSDLSKVAQSADDGSTAWAQNTSKNLAMTTPFTVPADGLYYAAIIIVAVGAGQLLRQGATPGIAAVTRTPHTIRFLSGQTDLPTTMTSGAPGSAISAPFVEVS